MKAIWMLVFDTQILGFFPDRNTAQHAAEHDADARWGWVRTGNKFEWERVDHFRWRGGLEGALSNEDQAAYEVEREQFFDSWNEFLKRRANEDRAHG